MESGMMKLPGGLRRVRRRAQCITATGGVRGRIFLGVMGGFLGPLKDA